MSFENDSLTPPIDPEVDGLLANLFMTEEGRNDPYSIYAKLHQKPPCHQVSLGMIVLTRFDDCQKLLRDNRFGKDDDTEGRRRERAESLNLSIEELDSVMKFFERRTTMLFLNPPDHTRLRGLVSRAFTPKTVEKLRPHVERLTDELLDELSGQIDIMDALAWKLPATVISEMLGVPLEMRETFRPLVRSATQMLEPTLTKEEFFTGIAAGKEMTTYLGELVVERRKSLGDDLLSKLIEARDGNDSLTEEELVSTAFLLYAAGFETTTNLIGNGLFALLKNPDQLAKLRSDPTLMPGAVEELLRFDSPVQFDGRSALQDADVLGYPVKEGQVVFTILGAANHDPAHFSDPSRLDVTRQEGPPMSFASGIHYCLGASLAKMEGQVVFQKLLDHFSDIELLDDPPKRRMSVTLRGITSLVINGTRA